MHFLSTEGCSPRQIFDKSVVIKQLSIIEAHGLLLFRADKGKLYFSVVNGIVVVENVFEKRCFSDRLNEAHKFQFFELTVKKQLTSTKCANQTHF